jgi:hypothetical protein
MVRNLERLALLAVIFTALASPLPAQDQERRILPAAIGGAAGVVGGGYVALAVVVTETRFGRYLHDYQDIFGWRSLPVIVGGGLGTALGYYSPERLKWAIIGGYIGMAAGGLIGLGVGQLAWRPPEGRWAGAAIGAGAGLVIGYLTGALTADSGDDLGNSEAAAIPLTIRIPLQ